MKVGDYVFDRTFGGSVLYRIIADDEGQNNGWFVSDPLSIDPNELRRFVFTRNLELASLVDLGCMKLKIECIMREIAGTEEKS